MRIRILHFKAYPDPDASPPAYPDPMPDLYAPNFVKTERIPAIRIVNELVKVPRKSIS
jgi:hypothetical protein